MLGCAPTRARPGVWRPFWVRGDTIDVVLRFHETDEHGVMGDPLNLTGYQFRAQVREWASTGTSEPPLLADATITILDQNTNRGQVRLVVPAHVSDKWPTHPSLDVEATAPDSTLHTWVTGQIEMGGQVTLPPEGSEAR